MSLIVRSEIVVILEIYSDRLVSQTRMLMTH